jgi:hypothetical protein
MIWPTQIITYALGAGCVVLGTLCGLQTVRVAHAKAQTAQAREALAQAVASAESAAHIELERLREQAHAQSTKQQEALDAATLDTERARAAAAAAGRAADGLRSHAASLARACQAQPGAAPASASAPASAPGDLLADMLGRIDAAAGELAEYADRARIAGLACERIHDSLTPERPQ